MGQTKKVPAEAFEQERLFLKPVPSTRKVYTDIITRTVHKNNTVFYGGNRYTVPLGTHGLDREVLLDIDGDKLVISRIAGNVIAEHTLSKSKGELVVNNSHRRDTTTKLDSIQGALIERFGDSDEAEVFLAQVRKLKPRYTRDQFSLIGKTLDAHDLSTVRKALNYCVTHNLYSAVEFRNAAEYFKDRLSVEMDLVVRGVNIIPIHSAVAIAKKRELSAYAMAAKGGKL